MEKIIELSADSNVGPACRKAERTRPATMCQLSRERSRRRAGAAREARGGGVRGVPEREPAHQGAVRRPQARARGCLGGRVEGDSGDWRLHGQAAQALRELLGGLGLAPRRRVSRLISRAPIPSPSSRDRLGLHVFNRARASCVHLTGALETAGVSALLATRAACRGASVLASRLAWVAELRSKRCNVFLPEPRVFRFYHIAPATPCARIAFSEVPRSTARCKSNPPGHQARLSIRGEVPANIVA